MNPHLKNLPFKEKQRTFREGVILKPKGKNFKLSLSETEGFYVIIEDTALERFYLLEYTGKQIFMSRFTLSASNTPLWQTMYVIPYEDVRDSRTGQLFPSKVIITKYGG